MKYGFFIRGQYRQGDDMVARFNELVEQARLADELGFSDLISGMHYAGYPLSQFQLLPFLSRIMGEAPNMRLVTGIILLSLHKPLDIAEQLATIDVMSNGRLVFGAGLGYREVEFRGFGTTIFTHARPPVAWGTTLEKIGSATAAGSTRLRARVRL